MTQAKEAAGILADARDLIGGGWCQGGLAKDAQGHIVNYLAKRADRFCLSGGIRRAAEGKPAKVVERALQAVADVLDVNNGLLVSMSFGIWNDHAERTQAEVMDVLAQGISALVPPKGVCGRCNSPAAVWQFDGHARFKLCTECAASWPLARD